MAYRKKTSTKRKPRKAKSMQAIAKRVVDRELRRNIELKTHFVNAEEVQVSTLSQGTNWYDLTSIDQGTTGNDRIGHKCLMKGIHIKGALHNNGNTTNYVRMAIFKAYTQVALGTLSTIFQRSTNASDFTALGGIRTMLYPFNNTELKCVWERTLKLNPAGSPGKDDESGMFSQMLKLNEPISFEGSSEGTDLQRPRYWFACWAAESPNDTALGEAVELSFVNRVFFTDA